jgi:hypothetical protein
VAITPRRGDRRVDVRRELRGVRAGGFFATGFLAAGFFGFVAGFAAGFFAFAGRVAGFFFPEPKKP